MFLLVWCCLICCKMLLVCFFWCLMYLCFMKKWYYWILVLWKWFMFVFIVWFFWCYVRLKMLMLFMFGVKKMYCCSEKFRLFSNIIVVMICWKRKLLVCFLNFFCFILVFGCWCIFLVVESWLILWIWFVWLFVMK